MNEEIQFGLGLDTGAFFTGARKIKSGWAQIKDDIKHGGKEIGESVKEWGRSLGELFAVEKLAEGGKKVLEFAESIEKGAEIAGTSTDFFQDFSAAVEQNGGSAEKAHKAMELLSSMIGQAKDGNVEAAAKFDKLGISIFDAGGNAKDTETVLREVMNLLSSTEDANKAAAEAVDLFGAKLGLQLVPALKLGSAGLDEFGKHVSKLTGEDLKSIGQFKDQLESSSNTAMVWGGKVVSAIAKVSAKLGTLVGGGIEGLMRENEDERIKAITDKTKPKKDGDVAASEGIRKSKEYIEAMAALKKARTEAFGAGTNEQGELIAKLEHEGEIRQELKDFHGNEIDRIKLETKLQEATNDVLKERKKINDKAAEKVKHDMERRLTLQNEINQAGDSVVKARENLEDAKNRRSQLSVEDLTTSKFRFQGSLGEDQQKAFQIKELERQAEWNRVHGLTGESKDRLSRADKIRDSLSSDVVESDRHPFKSMQETLIESKNHLKEIVDKASKEGLKVDIASLPQ